MFYFNRPYDVWSKHVKNYDLNCIELGQEGDHAKCVSLPVTREAGRRLVGLRNDLSIGTTRSDRPRINHKKSPDMFLTLSARPCKDFRPRFDDATSRGTILIPPEQPLEPFCCGYGFLQNWSECIVEAQPGDAFAVTISDFAPSMAATYLRFYLVGRDEVFDVCEYDAYDVYRGLLSAIGREPPKWFKEDGFNTWSWTNILRHPAMHDLITRYH